MGDRFGGGSLRSCQATASAGAEEACTAYLNMNKQLNETEGHPVAGQMPGECIP